MSELEEAIARQNAASTPFNSSWVSANAGSGKTRVLTDRVARLLLRGVDPQRILCLTYTKAAASEMQGRLFKRLGEWAMMPDAELATALGGIGETVDLADLAQARTLFARALETPGGLKIQTIHAFCGNVLRRFPLEAGISPQFKELDDAASKNLIDRVIEEMAEEGPQGSFDALAPFISDPDAARKLAFECLDKRAALASFNESATIAALGIDPNTTEAEIKARAVLDIGVGTLRDIYAAIIAHGTTNPIKAVAPLADLPLEEKAFGVYPKLERAFLTTGNEVRKPSTLPGKPVEKAVPGTAETTADVLERFAQARQEVHALQAFQRSKAAAAFASDFVTRYEARKRDQGALDFNDLIETVAELLQSPDRARWVQYRIDASIDHILVDEAQDTSPRQWDIVQALEAEFTDAGEGTGTPRTVFVVGDPKQSIFGFQGADVAGFTEKHDHFDARLQSVGRQMHSVDMQHSFRSAGPILQAVDAVFQEAAGIGAAPQHRYFASKPGRVDLWPFIKGGGKQDKPERFTSMDHTAPEKAARQLATKVAGFVAGELDQGRLIPDGDGWRRMTAGDVMILVRSRGPFFHTVINELKRVGVPVAGADKMRLLDVLAVKDVLSLLKFLDHDGDDLALAEALRSPLFGLSEQELYTLAQGRPSTLWLSLRDREAFAETAEKLEALRTDLGFKRPYEVLEIILTEQGGRARLNARLGPETDEALDELLSLALGFEQQQSPSLTNFIAWIAASDVEVKRQMDNVNAALRVMTVHGAKGLEAPVVIVPHLDKGSAYGNNMVLSDGDYTYLSASSKTADPPALDEMRWAAEEKEKQEADRLLYVALTRAESWLVVCGAAKSDKGWYTQVADAFEQLEGVSLVADSDPEVDPTQTLRNGQWKDDFDVGAAEGRAEDLVELPGWAQAKPASEGVDAPAINPSKLGGAHALAGALGDASDAAMARGDLIHQLLDVLPRAPKETRVAWGQSIVKTHEEGPDLIEKAMELIEDPKLAHIFAPEVLAEIEVAAKWSPDAEKIIGRADRVIVGPETIECIDFKSNRQVPETAQDVPKGLLAQMGAYRAALQAVWPERKISTQILWTQTASLMDLPNELVDEAFAQRDEP